MEGFIFPESNLLCGFFLFLFNRVLIIDILGFREQKVESKIIKFGFLPLFSLLVSLDFQWYGVHSLEDLGPTWDIFMLLQCQW